MCACQRADNVSAGFTQVIDVLKDGQSMASDLIDLRQAREHLIECLVEADDEVMEQYLEGQLPDIGTLRRLMPHAVLRGTLIPIFCVSSKQRVGLTELLDGLGMCAPSPDMLCRHGMGPDGESLDLCADNDAPLVARVFETHIDPFVQKLSYIRVISGTLAKDQIVHIAGARKNLKMPQILEMQGNQTAPIDRAEAGQIVAVAKQEDLHTGSILGDVELPPIPFPNRWSVWPWLPKAVAMKTNWPTHCISWSKKMHVAAGSRFADQRTGHHRHERVSSENDSRNDCTIATNWMSKPGIPRYRSAKQSKPTRKARIVTVNKAVVVASLVKFTFVCSRCPKARTSKPSSAASGFRV